METMLGWCSILPRALNVLPPKDKSFWVRASELGVPPPEGPPNPGSRDAGPGAKPLEH